MAGCLGKNRNLYSDLTPLLSDRNYLIVTVSKGGCTQYELNGNFIPGPQRTENLAHAHNLHLQEISTYQVEIHPLGFLSYLLYNQTPDKHILCVLNIRGLSPSVEMHL